MVQEMSEMIRSDVQRIYSKRQSKLILKAKLLKNLNKKEFENILVFKKNTVRQIFN